jgi:hypothetical protein
MLSLNRRIGRQSPREDTTEGVTGGAMLAVAKPRPGGMATFDACASVNPPLDQRFMRGFLSLASRDRCGAHRPHPDLIFFYVRHTESMAYAMGA